MEHKEMEETDITKKKNVLSKKILPCLLKGLNYANK